MILGANGFDKGFLKKWEHSFKDAVLLLWSPSALDHELAAINHVSSHFPRVADSDKFLNERIHVLCVLDEVPTQVLSHNCQQVGCLYFELESISVEDNVLDSIDFEVEFDFHVFVA